LGNCIQAHAEAPHAARAAGSSPVPSLWPSVDRGVPSAPTKSGGFEYLLDDGSGGFAIGPSEFDAMMMWGNYFEAEPGAEWITTIRVSFPSGLPVGTPVTLVVFDDPDDDLDPTNAIPLALASGRSVPTGPQEFVDFRVRP